MASAQTTPAQPLSNPHEEALLQLMRTSDAMQRAVQLRLKPAGISATQYNVLRILRGAEAQGLTCSAIGSRMITAEPDITRLLGRLKAQKLVQQKRSRQDRRVLWTHISPLGLELLRNLDGEMKRMPGELLKELTRPEVAELNRLLRKAMGCAGDASQPEAAVSGKRPLRQLPRPHPRPE